MKGSEWLDEVERQIAQQCAEADASRPDPETLAFSCKLRVVVMHDAGGVVLLSPSISSGDTIASRLQERIKHLDIQQFAASEATVDAAVRAALTHLRG